MDPIADLLTRIRNGQTAKHAYVNIRWSKLKQAIVEVLKKEKLIESYLVRGEDKKGEMRIFLKYGMGRAPVIQGLKRISTPGCRRYIKYDEIQEFYGGSGVNIVSTSHGVMTGKEAKEKKAGGELLARVW